MAPPPKPADPRAEALGILVAAEAGTFADALIEQARPLLSTLDSALLTELVYGTLRNRSRIDWTLDRLSAQPVDAADVWTRNILRLGAYQILFLDRIPASAAVNTAVELSKRRGRKPGYVNGLLRNLDRKKQALGLPLDDDPVRRLALLHSHPEWLVARWVQRYGSGTVEAELLANNNPSPLMVRVNRLRATREELGRSLESQGARVRMTDVSPLGLELLSGPPLRSLKAFQQGWFTVQDEAAQLAGLILDPRPGQKVLDACAAPGGKATHLAELMQDQGRVTALDVDASRLQRVRETADRLGLSIIAPLQGDAVRFREGAFDRILVDAPCSGLGVLRRHPDARWTKKEDVIADRAALQREILTNCAGLLRPDGALVYATCTTEPEENDQVIASFLADAGREFTVDDPRPLLPPAAHRFVDGQGFLRTFPGAPRMDGFFMARLAKARLV